MYDAVIRFYHRLDERSGVSYGIVVSLLLAFVWLIVATVVYTLIAVASVAGGAYLALRRPDLGGFRHHVAGLWRGLRR